MTEDAIFESGTVDCQKIDYPQDDDHSIRLPRDRLWVFIFVAEDSGMSDGVSYLKRYSLSYGPALRNDAYIVDCFSLFGEALSAGEDEDLDAIFEGVELVGREQLQEGDIGAKD